MHEAPERPHRTGHAVLDFVIAACAIVISCASLWVALRADKTQEQLLKSTVWPYVVFTQSDVTPQGTSRLTFELRNEGVGPAIVRSFAVAYNGRFYPSLRTLMEACCRVEGEPRLRITTSTVRSQVLMARDVFSFIRTMPSTTSPRSYARLFAERWNFSIQLCYCSVLGDCWFLDSSREDHPTAVNKCPPARQPQYLT
jgi:hypothetical protein